MTKQHINDYTYRTTITIPKQTFNQLEGLRGDVSRSRFISRLIEIAFTNSPQEVQAYIKRNKV